MPGRSRCSAICLSWAVRARKGTAIPASGLLTRALMLIAYGPRSAAMAEAAKARGVAAVHCQTAEEVLQYVRQFVRPGDAVLVKASHSMGLEQLLQEYYKELPQG